MRKIKGDSEPNTLYNYKEPMNTLYINDNLTVLQSLKDNSIDCIYADPPYLTGNTKLTYKDNKKETEWIEFMRERLVECKRVMKPAATILLHIDKNMMVELHCLMYEIFGKKNYIETFCWKKRASASMQSKFSQTQHEYILAFAKDKKKCKWNGIPQFDHKPVDNQLQTHNVNGNVGKGPNQTYPLFIEDDGTQLAQRLDKVSKTDRTPETRPNATYPIHYASMANYPAEGHEISEDDPMYMGGRDGYGDYKHISLWGGGVFKQNTNGKFPLHTSKTKISLTPFPGSIEVLPMNGKELGCWRCIPTTCQKLIDADMLVVKNGKIYAKQYANWAFDRKTGKLIPTIRTTPISSILSGDSYPTNQRSNKEIKEIFGKTAFSYSKPLQLVKSLLKVITNEGDTVLDIFAGSGTTGQAAFELKRKFILIQIAENGIEDLIKIRLDKTVGKDNYEVK